MPLNRIDALVKGGVPPRTVVLVSGPPGSGKTTVALQMLAEHLASGGVGLIIGTEMPPDQLLSQAGVGAPLRKFTDPCGGLWVLDAYSWRAGQASSAPNVLALPSLSSLSDLSIHVSEALEKARDGDRPLLVVFDTPSTLALHAGPETLLKFVDLVAAKVKAAGGALLLPVEKGVHPESFLAAMSYRCDGVLELRLEEEQDDLARYLRVQAMRTATVLTNRWARMVLSEEGVELVPAAKP